MSMQGDKLNYGDGMESHRMKLPPVNPFEGHMEYIGRCCDKGFSPEEASRAWDRNFFLNSIRGANSVGELKDALIAYLEEFT